MTTAPNWRHVAGAVGCGLRQSSRRSECATSNRMPIQRNSARVHLSPHGDHVPYNRLYSSRRFRLRQRTKHVWPHVGLTRSNVRVWIKMPFKITQCTESFWQHWRRHGGSDACRKAGCVAVPAAVQWKQQRAHWCTATRISQPAHALDA